MSSVVRARHPGRFGFFSFFGCGLRRSELAALDVEILQLREKRWVLADLRGKGGRVRTVAVPLWVKQGINAWMTAAGIEEGRLFRSVRKGGRKIGEP